LNISYEEAKVLGIAHLWPSRTDRPPPEVAPGLPSTGNDPVMNKLEAAFWERLQRAGYEAAYHEPFKLRLAGHCHYSPDFAGVASSPVAWDVFEVKGPRVWEDSIIKLRVAASLYPSFRFYLVKRPKKMWTVQAVTVRGISNSFWCPEWLR
jgi:hypothetical protein